jgi:hypothetical protein
VEIGHLFSSRLSALSAPGHQFSAHRCRLSATGLRTALADC